jgi:DNA-binding NarL/FixJ family response regulator
MSVKLLIVDDHPMLRKGARDVLNGHPGLIVTGEAGTAAQAMHQVQELSPDVVLMDIHLPDMSGLAAARLLHDASPALKIVVFSSDDDRALVDEALQAGALGYVLKTAGFMELISAVETVSQGKVYLSASVSSGIVEDYRKRVRHADSPARPLPSDRDQRLLQLVADGRRNKEIAGELGLSIKTVEANRSRLMRQFQCTNSPELIRHAIREGIVKV